MSIITLLTDFGNRDEYVGLMKGVILSINPSVTIVDITHQIDSQDIVQAAYAIHATYRYFPEGSVHLLVVDPGVGTGRPLLAFEMRKQYFVAPDNGVLTLLFKEGAAASLVRLSNSEYYLDTVSPTFHGRDIIAPVGAHISQGVDLHQLGDEITRTDAVYLENIYPHVSDTGEIDGAVVAVDHFGNLISNIDCQMLGQVEKTAPRNKIRIQIGSHTIIGIYRTYQNVRPNTALGLIGSRGYLEIAVNKGNAARILNARKGDAVRVII
jgi:S-adenosyl-L-methionine hydrolase (adenosine-forming)